MGCQEAPRSLPGHPPELCEECPCARVAARQALLRLIPTSGLPPPLPAPAPRQHRAPSPQQDRGGSRAAGESSPQESSPQESITPAARSLPGEGPGASLPGIAAPPPLPSSGLGLRDSGRCSSTWKIFYRVCQQDRAAPLTEPLWVEGSHLAWPGDGHGKGVPGVPGGVRHPQAPGGQLAAPRCGAERGSRPPGAGSPRIPVGTAPAPLPSRAPVRCLSGPLPSCLRLRRSAATRC